MLKNFINYSLFSFLNSALVFINGFLLAKYTSLEIFGLISFYQVIIIGLSQLINWNTLGLIPIAISGSIRLNFDEYIKIIHFLMIILSLFALSILIIFIYFSIYDFSINFLMLFVVLLISTNDIDNSRLIGFGYSLNYGLSLFITRIIQSLLILILGVNDSLNINSWFILIIISEVFSLIYRRNFTLFNLIGNFKNFISLQSSSNIKYIFLYGLKYFPILIIGYLFQYADRYFLKILMSPTDLGLFGYALLLSSSVSIFSSSLLNVLVPRIYNHDLASSKKILIFSFKINLVAGFIIIIATEYMLPFISFLVGKPEIESLSSIFLLTSIGIIFQGMYKIIGAMLDANILYWQKFFSFIFAFTVNIITLYLFFNFSEISVLKFGISYLIGNISLFALSLYFVMNQLKTKT